MELRAAGADATLAAAHAEPAADKKAPSRKELVA